MKLKKNSVDFGGTVISKEASRAYGPSFAAIFSVTICLIFNKKHEFY